MDCWEYIGDLKATDINDLEEKIIQDLEITLIPEKKMGGQTVGTTYGRTLLCKHPKLGFECQLEIGQSQLKTKEKLIEIFRFYLIALLN